jgi:hypothetical protein
MESLSGSDIRSKEAKSSLVPSISCRSPATGDSHLFQQVQRYFHVTGLTIPGPHGSRPWHRPVRSVWPDKPPVPSPPTTGILSPVPSTQPRWWFRLCCFRYCCIRTRRPVLLLSGVAHRWRLRDLSKRNHNGPILSSGGEEKRAIEQRRSGNAASSTTSITRTPIWWFLRQDWLFLGLIEGIWKLLQQRQRGQGLRWRRSLSTGSTAYWH